MKLLRFYSHQRKTHFGQHDGAQRLIDARRGGARNHLLDRL